MSQVAKRSLVTAAPLTQWPVAFSKKGPSLFVLVLGWNNDMKESTRNGESDFKDRWVAQLKQCKYLPEPDMKKLCELVCTDKVNHTFWSRPCARFGLLWLLYDSLTIWHFSGQRALTWGVKRSNPSRPNHNLWWYTWPILWLDEAFWNWRWFARYKLHIYGVLCSLNNSLFREILLIEDTTV